MKQQNVIKKAISTMLFVLLMTSISFAWAGKNSGTSGTGGTDGGTTTTQVYDTSFAVEFSYSCLEGGCHEKNQQLVDEYSQSFMTHAMVKCNACHGTHTAAEVGLEKPNLTGYTPGIGSTGYIVGMDRCKACHSNVHVSGKKSTKECVSCHTPHVFKR